MCIPHVFINVYRKKEVRLPCVIISDMCGTYTEFNLFEAVFGDMRRDAKTDNKFVGLN